MDTIEDQRRRRRRLSKAAAQAVARYGLDDARITFIGHSENATYRVQSPSGERFLLRLHVPHHRGAVCAGTQTLSAIASELAWLTALAEDGIPVPNPQPDPTGAPCGTIEVAGEDQPVPITLMRWLEGRFPPSLTTERCRSAGRLMARLHNHAAAWQPPTGFHRPRWDDGTFTQSLAELEALTRSPAPGFAVTPDQVAVFRACAERILETTKGPGCGPDSWGLIHADLHPGNLLFHRGEPRAIDFSRCGHGHWVYDIAECCRFIGRDSRRAFAEGYADVRPLPENYPALLEAFFIRGWIENFAFHAPNPKEQDWLRQAIPPTVERLEQTYLRGEAYLTY